MPRAQKTGEPRSLMARGVAFLARREYSKAQLRHKLLECMTPDESEEAVDETLTQLSAKGYLNEDRYAEAVCRLRAPRYGNRRLVQELQDAGLESSTIEAALQDLPAECARAYAVWERRFSWAPADEKERARQIRFLASRGFEYAAIAEVLKKAPVRTPESVSE